jgi:two-component system sensor histidine kinase CpxA
MALDQVERETTRLSELVEELLDVARAEADPNTIEAEPIEILPLVEEIAAQCEIEARAKGCWIEISCFRPGAIQGDRELLRRALENVFRNAIRYGPPDSMIRGTVSGADNGVTIQVRDSGPGVPPESLDLVFDPFYRVSLDRDRKTGGVGLGLAITKRAISLHGGTVRALNQVPGLMVEISLPRSMPGPVPGSQYLVSPPVQRA